MRTYTTAALVLVLAVAVTGCQSQNGSGDGGDGGTGAASAPTLEQLNNMTYTLPDGRTATLVDGSYEELPAPDAAVAIVRVNIVEDLTAFGDLNGDGVDDASVILVDAPGGSGVFNYLATVVGEGGEPSNADTVALGDRTFVKTNTVADQTIALEVDAHAEDDPMCCPSEQRVWTYALEGGSLTQTGNEYVGTVEP